MHRSTAQVLDMLKQVSPRLQAPVIMFQYYNPILRCGLDDYCQRAQAAGASGELLGARASSQLQLQLAPQSPGQAAQRLSWSTSSAGADPRNAGLLVPDVPVEETSAIREVTGKYGLELVLLTTPTTPRPRATQIAQLTQGFIYLVSVTGAPWHSGAPSDAARPAVSRADSTCAFSGVTGSRTSMEDRVQGLIEQLHDTCDAPVAVGFGVSGPSQVRPLSYKPSHGSPESCH